MSSKELKNGIEGGATNGDLKDPLLQCNNSANDKLRPSRAKSSESISIVMTPPTDEHNPSLLNTGVIRISNSVNAIPDDSLLSPNTARLLNTGWRLPLEKFTFGREHEDVKNLSKAAQKFYKKQDQLINEFEDIYYNRDGDSDSCIGQQISMKDKEQLKQTAAICAKVSFGINFLLFCGKMVATIISGSLAIMSSLVDSAVDLISGIVMWWTSSAMRKKDYVKFPTGKTRMEPLAILILSVIMSMASAMMIIKSAEQIQEYILSDNPEGPIVDVESIILISLTIFTKFIMFMTMRRVQSPSVQALSQDHRNDVLSNIMALVMSFVGDRYWVYADPVGGILIALYILGGWCITAYEQVHLLVGRSASADFLKKITWTCINHNPAITHVDTVFAYHFGNNFLVEVDIVMPEDIKMREAHDIAESLQLRIERMNEVERCFVHIDYETEHSRSSEHIKQ